MGMGGGLGGQPRDRVQENLSKAFSLLDDDKPKTAQTGAGHYYGDRVGTAPTSGYPMGSGIQRSNYTGSDMGDSLHDDRNQVPSLGLA